MADAVVFDLDGTLIDSAPDIAAALNNALAAEPLPTLPLEVVRGMIGDGVKALIAKALAHLKLHEEAERGARLYAAFQAYARRYPVVDTTVYAGITDLLVELKGRGVRLGVCTNKTAALAELIVRALPFGDCISVVAGGDGPHPPKPHPASLVSAVAALGAPADRTIYVGDMRVDWLTAERAGIRFVGVDHGHWDAADPDLGPLVPAIGASGLARLLLREGPPL